MTETEVAEFAGKWLVSQPGIDLLNKHKINGICLNDYLSANEIEKSTSLSELDARRLYTAIAHQTGGFLLSHCSLSLLQARLLSGSPNFR
jgi:hypothetical protein